MNTKNTMRYKKLFLWIFLIFLNLPALKVFAAAAVTQTYTPLEPNALPGVTESAANLGSFLGSVFNFGIAAAVVLALIMIIWGGIEYMTTDAWMKKGEGKKRITDALLGLGLALVSWLLLYIINPNLVTYNGNLLLNPATPAKTSQTAPITNNAAGSQSTASQTNSANTNPTGSSGCPGPACIDASGMLACKDTSKCYLDGTFANELAISLAGQNARVTEAYPPTTEHESACHQNGTCADVNLLNSDTNVNDVKQVYASMVNAGLHPSYETSSDAACQPYLNDNIPCIVSPLNTAPSFHVNM